MKADVRADLPELAACSDTIVSGSQTLERVLTWREHRQTLLCTRGVAVVTLDGSVWKLRPGSIAIVPSGCVCNLQLAPGAALFRIAASEQYLKSRVLPALFAPSPSYWTSYYVPFVADMWVGPENRRTRERLLAELEAAQSRLGLECDAAVVAYMYVILFGELQRGRELNRQVPQQETHAPASQLVMSFRGWVEQHFRKQMPLSGYCDLLGVSQVRLMRACKTVLGCKPSAVIHDRLMLEAKRELMYTSNSASQIAYGLGFEDAAYFSRFFKQRTGKSPLEFRRAHSPIHPVHGSSVSAALGAPAG
jgi:AraC family transcriptional regulator, transcriptional activator of pobA